MSTTSVAKKLAAVFGVGSTLTAVYGEGKVTYANDNTRVGFDLAANDSTASGTYSVNVVSETEIKETFVQPLEVPKVAAKPKPSSSQSPMFGEKEKRQSR